MIDYDEWKAEQMDDPEYRAAWEALQPACRAYKRAAASRGLKRQFWYLVGEWHEFWAFVDWPWEVDDE